MAGVLPGFDPDGFRDAIRFAMNLGAPPDAEQRATFRFPRVRTAVGGEVDSTGAALNPDARITFEPPRTVQVPCGVESATASDLTTSIGRFGAERVVITLLDEDYAQVVGFEAVLIGGVVYYYVRELPPTGLGEVGIHQVECRTEAEA